MFQIPGWLAEPASQPGRYLKHLKQFKHLSQLKHVKHYKVGKPQPPASQPASQPAI